MKYEKPSYIEDLPEYLQKYFTDEMFKDTPYPPNLEAANDFLLYKVFKVTNKDIISIVKTNEAGDEIIKSKDFTKDNYHEIFNYNYWKNLQNSTKIVVLYWLYEEICAELKVYPPKFNFLRELPCNAGAMYDPRKHEIIFHLSVDDEEETIPSSAYQDIEYIAHELKHSIFWTKNHKKLNKNENKICYLEAPIEENYDMKDDFDRFCYYYDKTLYYLQPTELESHNYGIKKAKQLFDETNKNSKGKIKNSASIIDLRYFRAQDMERNHNVKFFNNVMNGPKEAREQVEKNMVSISFLNEIEVIATQILTLDPTAEVKNEKIYTRSKDENVQKLLKQYNSALYSYETLCKEIEKDIKRLYKNFKQLEADTKIILYKN